MVGHKAKLLGDSQAEDIHRHAVWVFLEWDTIQGNCYTFRNVTILRPEELDLFTRFFKVLQYLTVKLGRSAA